MIFNARKPSATNTSSGSAVEEKLELINSVTISTSVSSVSISEDSNGNAIKLKRAVVSLKLVMGSYGWQVAGRTANGKSIIADSRNNSDGDSTVTGYVSYARSGDYWITENHLGALTKNTTSNVLADSSNITSVAVNAMYSADGQLLANMSYGTIELYGVRA